MVRATGRWARAAVVDNAALVFNPSGTATIGNAISGSGTVTQTYGTLILTGANTYTRHHDDRDSGVTLQVGNGGTTGTLGSGAVTSGGSTIRTTAQLVFNRSNGVTVSNAYRIPELVNSSDGRSCGQHSYCRARRSTGSALRSAATTRTCCPTGRQRDRDDQRHVRPERLQSDGRRPERQRDRDLGGERGRRR